MNNETMEYFKVWEIKNGLKFPSWIKEEDKHDYVEYAREKYRRFKKLGHLTKDLAHISDPSVQTWFDELIKRPDFPQIMSGLIKHHDIWGDYIGLNNFKINSAKRFSHPTLGNVLKIDYTYTSSTKSRPYNEQKYFSETSRLILESDNVWGPEGALGDAFSVTEMGIANSSSNDFVEILRRVNGDKVINGKTYDEILSERCRKEYKFQYFRGLERIERLVEENENGLKSNHAVLPNILDSNKINFDTTYRNDKNFQGLFESKIME